MDMPERIWAYEGEEIENGWDAQPIGPGATPYTRDDLVAAKDQRIKELEAQLSQAEAREEEAFMGGFRYGVDLKWNPMLDVEAWAKYKAERAKEGDGT